MPPKIPKVNALEWSPTSHVRARKESVETPDTPQVKDLFEYSVLFFSSTKMTKRSYVIM